MSRGSLGPALALMLNAFVWGVSWWPFRQLEAAGVHPLWATALVYMVAVAAITIARPAAWRELFAHPALWLLVLGSGCTNAAFNWAVTIGDVVRVVLLFYLMPLRQPMPDTCWAARRITPKPEIGYVSSEAFTGWFAFQIGRAHV